MTAHATATERRFVRNADRAWLAGVCAGIADYFGFNLGVTRLLVVIAFFAAMPVTLIAYFAMVCLVPAESKFGHTASRCGRRRARRMSRRERRDAAEESRREAAEEVSRRARSLDERLARIEKYVTSSRYDLDREFRNL